MSKLSFLIVGTNFINKGAEAMMKTVSHEILKRYKDADIFVICHQEEEEVAKQQGFIPLYVEYYIIEKIIDRVVSKFKNILGLKAKPYADYTPIQKIMNIDNLKTVIDASGFAYGDKRGYQQPLESQKIIDYCKQIDVPYIIMPQAWGSFNDPIVAKNVKHMIEASDHFFTRDDVSRSYVSKLLNRPEQDIPLVPDIAFHFPIPEIDGVKLLSNFSLDLNNKKQPLLGLSPNMRIYERMNGSGQENEYVKILIKIINHYKHKFNIVLIPNEIRPGKTNLKDDAYLCNLIYNSFVDNSNLTLVKGYHTAEEIKAIIKETHIMIASRFHSLIFALSLGIPCLAISWSHKYKELFKLFDLERFVVEDKGLQLEKATHLFDELMDNHTLISDRILEELPKIKNKNAFVFDLL